MKNLTFIVLFFSFLNNTRAQEATIPDFVWGNSNYFNISKGQTIIFQEKEIELLKIENHFNQIRIERDTLWLKVSRRTLPVISNGIRLFVADNKNVKALAQNNKAHGLLENDVLLCLLPFTEKYLNENQFIFPVSFNDGFTWRAEENSHMFSFHETEEGRNLEKYSSHPGIDIDLFDARGLEKHVVVAIEASRVVWVEDKNLDAANKQACILLESSSQPGIYYVYDRLYNKNIYVKEGQYLVRGEAIATAWGDEIWGHLQIAVLKSDSVPTYPNRYQNLVNFFPQLFELYFKQTFIYAGGFSKGQIYFGHRRDFHGNAKNISAFEDYLGKGWNFGSWNIADKTECIVSGVRGNARLRKTLFKGTEAASRNPENHFDYEIKVSNGTYRIRALMGDLKEPSWQRISFEGINAGTFILAAGEQKWTNERVVKVNDGKITVRIYIQPDKNQAAGISEIVFQKAY